MAHDERQEAAGAGADGAPSAEARRSQARPEAADGSRDNGSTDAHTRHREPSSHPFSDTSDDREDDFLRADAKLITTSHRAFSIEASYANLGEIARGNMGAIIRTRDRDLERDVALKVMLNKQSSPEARMRFLREAQITGQLEHPNIVPIHCLGTDTHGNPVFSMKLVRGITVDQVLEDTLRKKRKTVRDWPLERLVAILIPVCHAIEFAHSKGIIHRDLKPSNIMLGDFGEVLVMDWGLAKPGVHGVIETRRLQAPLHRIVAERRERARNKHLAARRHDGTAHGSIVGTPKYMSPEQARGEIEHIDPRSDVYALGAILYDILALTPPISGESVDDILDRVVAGDIVPPERTNPRREIPKELSAIAMKALSLEARERYQSVAGFREDLQRWQQHHSVSAKDDTGWEVITKLFKRNRTSAIVLAIALGIGTLGATLNFWSNSIQRQRTQQVIDDLREENEAHQTVLRSLAPALLESAVAALDTADLVRAIERCQQAVAYDPDLRSAQALLARLHILGGGYARAEALLRELQQQDHADEPLRRLIAFCRQARIAVPDSYGPEFAALFSDQGDAIAQRVLTQHLDQQFAQTEQRLAIELPDAKLSRDGEGHWSLKAVTLPDPLVLGGLPLSTFTCLDASRLDSCDILRGMPLRELLLRKANNLADLTALRGMDLHTLALFDASRLESLSALTGLPLKELRLDGAPLLSDLGPLASLPLETLQLSGLAKLSELGPLTGLPLKHLLLIQCPQAADLRPLAGLRLESLVFNPERITLGLEAIRAMPTLTQLGRTNGLLLPSKTFWTQLDAGQP